MPPRRPKTRSTDPADYQSLPVKVAAMAKRFASGHEIAPHDHARDQLLFAVSGVMAVRTPREAWIVPPDRAVYLPARTRHSLRIRGDLEMRTLYITSGTVPALRGEPCVIEVSALLRELVLALFEEDLLYDEGGRGGMLARLALSELGRARRLPLSVPMPEDLRLKKVCDALLADPACDWPLERWSESVGAAPRTLARLFERELGMGFALWRRRVRFHDSVAALVAGAPVAQVARRAGYRSVSAYAAAFRQAMGMAPSALGRGYEGLSGAGD